MPGGLHTGTQIIGCDPPALIKNGRINVHKGVRGTKHQHIHGAGLLFVELFHLQDPIIVFKRKDLIQL